MTSGVCFYWVYFGKQQPQTDGYYESGALFLIYVRFIHGVSDWLATECLVLYLYYKSLITEQQFTIGGLFNYVYCVYISLESRFHSSRREPKYGNVGPRCETYEWTWSTDCYWEGSNQVLGTKPVTVSICLPQIPDAVSWVWTRSTKRPAANRLKHSIAPEQFKIGRCVHHHHSDHHAYNQ